MKMLFILPRRLFDGAPAGAVVVIGTDVATTGADDDVTGGFGPDGVSGADTVTARGNGAGTATAGGVTVGSGDAGLV